MSCDARVCIVSLCFLSLCCPTRVCRSWFLVRNDARGRSLLTRWLDQWRRYKDNSWVWDQGFLQETVLLQLHASRAEAAYPRSPLFPYDGSCARQRMSAHRRNLCYRDMLESWGHHEGHRVHGMHGLCLLPLDVTLSSGINLRVNQHGDPKPNDHFIHSRAFTDVSTRVEHAQAFDNSTRKRCAWGKKSKRIKQHALCEEP